MLQITLPELSFCPRTAYRRGQKKQVARDFQVRWALIAKSAFGPFRPIAVRLGMSAIRWWTDVKPTLPKWCS